MWPVLNGVRFMSTMCLNAGLTQHIKIGLGFLSERLLKRLRNLRNFIKIWSHLHVPVFMILTRKHVV